MHNKADKFDLKTCSLNGVNIIEASAGTGKTYTIQNLFAKMILLKGYSIDSILVVTFTDAATKELKTRIRDILNEVNNYYLGNKVSDDIKELADSSYTDCYNKIILSKEIKEQRIYDAITNFDDAAIFTIHGFCNKVLNDYSFESGILFNVNLEKNIEPIVRDIIEDFWRLETYSTSLFNISALNYNSINIDSLVSYIKNFTNKGDIQVFPEKMPELGGLNLLKEIISNMRRAWDNEKIKTILQSPEISKSKFRESAVNNHIKNVELFFEYSFDKIIIDSISKLTTENIDSAITKKGRTNGFIANHPFFNHCSEFIANIDLLTEYGIYFRNKCRKYFQNEYEKRKSELNIQSFNDLLSKVDEFTGSSKSPLLKKLRNKYNAAFIDEFQDTDSIQYSIFKKIFIDPNKTIFMVGDPKQAIYGFRGGDVFTYQKAKEQISSSGGNIYTLPKNWRSSPNMVNAVNALFKDKIDKYKPFVTDSIKFIEVEADKNKRGLIDNSELNNKPLKFIFFKEENNADELSDQCIKKTAELIYDLLSGNKTQILDKDGEKRKIRANDIAILVTKHKQAKQLQPELSKYKIPSVLQATGSVFDTLQAEDFVYILNAVAEPSNTMAVKGALLTDILSFTIEELAMFSENIESDTEHIMLPEDIFSKFKKCHNIWLNSSFIEMFNTLCMEFDIKSRVLKRNNGERVLTNILHLTELLQAQETDSKLGINGLTFWLSKQLNPDTREDNEEYEIRLDTDENAVKIMTVFKSKGLEFPIVICPFLWDKNSIADRYQKAYKYHLTPDVINKTQFASNMLYKPILDVSGTEEAKFFSNDEILEELMRFMYVALTRSKYRCYVLWGNTGRTSKKDTSALDYQFFSDNKVMESEKGNISKSLSYSSRAAKNAKISPSLNDEQDRYIQLDINETNSVFQIQEYKTEKLVAEPEFRARKVNLANYKDNWSISSFTSITPHPVETNVLQKDYDETDNPGSNDDNLSILEQTLNIFNFPAGAKTGTCWHEIFEELDYTSPDEDIRMIVREKLIKYRLLDNQEKESITCIEEMVRNTLNTSLFPSMSSNLKLKYISQEDKLPELEFYFEIKNKINTQTLYDKIFSYAENKGFRVDHNNMNEKMIRGFMTGFIDLLFRHEDRYYIIDWKSNKLNQTPNDFKISGLKEEMSKHYYYLQYLIYTVAVDKYLSTRIKDYCYDLHFGGVYYIFLRGVDSQENSRKGIFFDKPEKSFIYELAEILS